MDNGNCFESAVEQGVQVEDQDCCPLQQEVNDDRAAQEQHNKQEEKPVAVVEKPAPVAEGQAPRGTLQERALDQPPVTDQMDQPPVAGVIKSFNPKFEGMGTETLEAAKRDRRLDFQTQTEVHVELIKRAENILTNDDIKESKESIALLLKAMKEDRAITQDADGKPIISNEPLSPEQRWEYHRAICGDLANITNRCVTKMDAAFFSFARGQYKDAQEFGLAGVAEADDLPLDLLKAESDQLKRDLAFYADPAKRGEMTQMAMRLSGEFRDQAANAMPITTRKFMTMLYLGTELKAAGGELRPEFGKTSAFKPELAFEMAKQIREKTKEIFGFDPLDGKQGRQDDEAAFLFGGLVDVMNNPEKYNLYKLVDEHKVEAMQAELKSHSGFESMLADVGVVALTAGTLALSRSPKVQAGVERMFARIGPNAERSAATATKIAGLGTVAVAAPLARHYGYKGLTGISESWQDTGVHVVGSLAAAELGGRLLGKGSMITGSPGKGLAVSRQFDKAGSAEWLTMHGYDTAGKLSGLLKQSGFAAESKILASLPANTALKSEAGLQAIERASLTNARFAKLAKSAGLDIRTRIQQAAMDAGNARSLPNGQTFGVATTETLNRARWTSGFVAGGAVATTYNSLVKTWDLAHTKDPRTGVDYTPAEAFLEAHFPTVLDANQPAWLRYSTSALVGTPGQALLSACLLRPGAIFESTAGSATIRRLFDHAPFSHRAWNNANAMIFAQPGMSGAGALAGSLWKPMIEDYSNNSQQSARFKELLKNSQTPIENRPVDPLRGR